MKKQKLTFISVLLLSLLLPTACGDDVITYSYSLDVSQFSDYQEGEYCRTNIDSLNDNNYPILAQVKPILAYKENSPESSTETINPFDTNLVYTRYAKEKLTSTKVIQDIENNTGELTHKLHALFDRHYYYFDKENRLINNLKIINDNYGSEEWITVDEHLYKVLKEAMEITKFSDGKFNLFVGELSSFWDNYIKRNQVLNNPESPESTIDPSHDPEETKLLQDILQNTPQVNDLDQVLEFDPDSYRVKFHKFKNADKVSISLGAIGKGYLTEHCYQNLKSNNLTYGMLNAGTSSMVFMGDRVVNDNWYLALSNPYGVYYSSTARLKLENTKYCCSTSGAQVNYYYTKINNQTILRNHIIDPTTGYPNDYYNQILLLSKTISSTKLDALSTILSNCSFDEIKSYIEKIRNSQDYGDLEFVFFKKDIPENDRIVNVYISKGLQKNKIFEKQNPTDCKVVYNYLNY